MTMPSPRARGPARRAVLLVVGLAALVIVLARFGTPRNVLAAYVAAYATVVSVSLGALGLVMIAHVSGANWFVVLRRQAEHVLASLPALAVLVLPLLVAMPAIYPWAAPRRAMSLEMRRVIEMKGAYLNPTFFTVRAIVYWTVWLVLGEGLRRASLAQDRSGGRDMTRRMRTISAAGLPVYALTLTFASFDWMMSLTPEWKSTIYGVYWFAGGILAAVALLAVLAEAARRAGRTEAIGAEHFHALGKLLMTFVLFWGYIAFAQLLIIWSGNLPAEVAWYVSRFRGAWSGGAITLVVGTFAVPFLALLLRAIKRSGALLALLGGWLLVMHCLDTYWIVLPLGGSIGGGDILLFAALLVLVGGIAFATAYRRIRGEAPVPVGDPLLEESVQYVAREA